MNRIKTVLAVTGAIGLLAVLVASALGATKNPKPGKWVGTTTQGLSNNPETLAPDDPVDYSSAVTFKLKQVGEGKYKVNFRTEVQTFVERSGVVLFLCFGGPTDVVGKKTPVRVKARVKKGRFFGDAVLWKEIVTQSEGSQDTYTLEPVEAEVRGRFTSRSKAKGTVSVEWPENADRGGVAGQSCHSGDVPWKAHR